MLGLSGGFGIGGVVGGLKVRDNAAQSDLVPGSRVSSDKLKLWWRNTAVVEIQQQLKVSCAV